MNIRTRSIRAAVLALAVVTATSTGLVFTGAANAADTVVPPWQTGAGVDPNAKGTLAFYDASGARVYGGSTTSPFATYVVASVANRAGDTGASLFAYTPTEGTAPGAWSGQALTGATSYGPVAGAPSSISTTLPVVKQTAGDTGLEEHLAQFPNASTTDGYQGVVELRLRTSGSGGNASPSYAVADVVVDTTAHTWKVVYGTTSSSSVAATVPATAPVGVAFDVPATVTAGGTTPTGKVTLKEGSTVLDSKPLVSGGATLTVGATALATGSHNLTVIYSGSGELAPSTTAAQTVNVVKPASTTTATVPASKHVGEAFTVPATVTGAGSTPTGTVTLKEGSTVIDTQTLASGAATLNVSGSALAGGSHSLTVVYGGSDLFEGSSSVAASVTITRDSSSVDANVPTSAFAGVTFNVPTTVSATGTTPTGTVTLKEGTTVLDTKELSGGAATLVAPATLAAGSHDLTVSYGGSTTLEPSDAAAQAVTVSKRTVEVTTTVPTKATYGKTFTVKATAATSVGPKPTGDVQLLEGTKVLYTKALSSGAATFTVAATKLAPGAHKLSVKYVGSASVESKTSAAKTVTVAKAVSKTTNKLSASSVKSTKQARLTVKVTATGVTPTGSIKVYDGSKLLGTYKLTAAKKGTYVVTLPKLKVGTHKIHSVFVGSSTVAKSTAATVTLKSTK